VIVRVWREDVLALKHRILGLQKCFLAKARPDPDFKYFSNASAWASSENAI
jgi:hypothetical protein